MALSLGLARLNYALTCAFSGTDCLNAAGNRDAAAASTFPITVPSFANTGLLSSLSVALLVSPRSEVRTVALSMSM